MPPWTVELCGFGHCNDVATLCLRLCGQTSHTSSWIFLQCWHIRTWVVGDFFVPFYFFLDQSGRTTFHLSLRFMQIISSFLIQNASYVPQKWSHAALCEGLQIVNGNHGAHAFEVHKVFNISHATVSAVPSLSDSSLTVCAPMCQNNVVYLLNFGFCPCWLWVSTARWSWTLNYVASADILFAQKPAVLRLTTWFQSTLHTRLRIFSSLLYSHKEFSYDALLLTDVNGGVMFYKCCNEVKCGRVTYL